MNFPKNFVVLVSHSLYQLAKTVLCIFTPFKTQKLFKCGLPILLEDETRYVFTLFRVVETVCTCFFDISGG
jgi:hypothetical protein